MTERIPQRSDGDQWKVDRIFEALRLEAQGKEVIFPPIPVTHIHGTAEYKWPYESLFTSNLTSSNAAATALVRSLFDASGNCHVRALWSQERWFEIGISVTAYDRESDDELKFTAVFPEYTSGCKGRGTCPPKTLVGRESGRWNQRRARLGGNSWGLRRDCGC